MSLHVISVVVANCAHQFFCLGNNQLNASIMIFTMPSYFFEADDRDCREVEEWWQARIRFLIGNGQPFDAAALFEDFELNDAPVPLNHF